MQFNDVITEEKYEAHQLWLMTDGKDGKRLNLSNANLRYANLTGAKLYHANLSGADLLYADLHNAGLYRADLSGANMFGANLTGANLLYADLHNADLYRACLSGANMQNARLCGANIDMSVWPMWCGSFNVKVDKRIAAQLAYHFFQLDCDDEEMQKAQAAIKELANQFHRVGDDVDKL
jgi:hypothetical protein